MKAVLFKKFGSPEVLQLAEIEKPIPKNNEVFVKIYATSVTAEDPKMRSFNHSPLLKLPIGLMYGFEKPKKSVLGMEAHKYVETGRKVGNVAVSVRQDDLT